MPAPVEIVDYDPAWPSAFTALADRVAASLGSLAVRVEHVGSTAVPGLPAKPIIDLIAVIPTRDDLPAAVGAYGAVKRRLAAEFGTDRDGYTEAKTGFVTGVLARVAS